MTHFNHILLNAGIFKKTYTFKRNDYIKIQDTIDTKVYYILEGSIKIAVFAAEEEQIIRLGYQDNIIVALDSFLTDKPSPLLIQAIKKTTVLVADKADFQQWVHQDIEHTQCYIQLLETLVLQQFERENDLLLATPQQRFERLYQRNPALFQLIPNRHIANYLKMSPETLSRLKKP